MSEKRFTFGAVSPNVSMIKLDGKPLNVGDVVVCLNRLCDEIKEQQATIQSLKEENRKLRNIHLSIDLTYSYGCGRYLADVRVIDDG